MIKGSYLTMSDDNVDAVITTVSTKTPLRGWNCDDTDPKSPTECLENTCSIVEEKQWNYGAGPKLPNILDPDDPLMERFQESLKTHLLRIHTKLSDEISNLETAIKDANNNREIEALKLYGAQEEINRQQSALEKYQSTLEELIEMRKEKETQTKTLNRMHQEAFDNVWNEKIKEKHIIREMESLSCLEHQLSEWEKEISSNLIISQRISEKDATIQKELVRQKQQEDYILFKMMSEIWKLEFEIKILEEQTHLKDEEKKALNQTIADANADLEALQREYKNLFNSWNSVVTTVRQRNKIYNEMCEERQRIRNSFRTLQSGIDKLRQETNKEMENNEQLTSLQSRIEEDIQGNLKLDIVDRNKINELESQLSKLSTMIEKSSSEYNNVESEYQHFANLKTLMQKDVGKLIYQKIQLEDEILLKLGERVTNDKAARYLNKILCDLKDVTRERELMAVQLNNASSKALLETGHLKTILINTKEELNEFIRHNDAKEREIDSTQIEIKRLESIIAKKQKEFDIRNKRIEEIISKTDGDESSPIDQKISTLEANIVEIEHKNRKLQQLWLRREGHIIGLTQQRNVQLQEISLISKQITIMEQRNFELQMELVRQRKEEFNMNRVINGYQQKLLQMNTRLAMQKGYKDLLEDKNFLKKSEFLKSLAQMESEVTTLLNDNKQMADEKINLREELNTLQRASLSWEKKVQLASETTENVKSERSSFGDVGIMTSEIHKMQIRLSHLKKAQEKLIQDMEYCVARRDTIVDVAMASEKRNPKGQHIQRTLFRKRLEDQKLKIKQIQKETRKIENQMFELNLREKTVVRELEESKKKLRSIEHSIPDIEKQITDSEMTKQHKLELLIRKQHEVKMFQNIHSGQHRMLYKSVSTMDAELQKQQAMNVDLKEIIEQTRNDFPLLKTAIQKILLTLGINSVISVDKKDF